MEETRHSLAYTDVTSIPTSGNAGQPITTRAVGSNSIRVRNNGTIAFYVWAFDAVTTPTPTVAQVVARGDYLGPDESMRFNVGDKRLLAFAAISAGGTAFIEEEQTVSV